MNDDFRSRIPLFPNISIVTLDVIGFVAWIYVVARLFVGDFERWFVPTAGSVLLWVLDMRPILAIIVAAILAVILGRNRFVGCLMYIMAFPMVLVAWKIPVILIKIGSWTVAFAVLNSILALLSDIVYRLASAALYVAGISMVALGDASVAMFGLAVLIGAILITYLKIWISAFRSPRILAAYSRVTSLLVKIYVDEKEGKAGPQGVRLIDMPTSGREQFVVTLQNLVIGNRVSLYLARKLQDYQNSSVFIAGSMITFVSMILVTLSVFSVLYFGVHKVWPESLVASHSMSTFDYVWVSFNNMLFDSGSDVLLAAWPSQALSMLQRFLSILMIGTLLLLILEVRNKKYEGELEKTVSEIKRTGSEVEAQIVRYYKYKDVSEAIDDLVQLNAGLSEFLVRLSASLEARTGP